MAVIAVYSPKGGVGKTTLAVDLAWRWAVQGARNTLLWDLDPQGGAGFLLRMDGSASGKGAAVNAASVFQLDGRPGALIRPTEYPGLSLLGADDSLRGLPVQLARMGHGRRLASVLQTLSRSYERIVLDCPPAQNELSEQILAVADVVIVPLPPSPLAIRALDGLRADLARQTGRHPPILPVLSMFDVRRKAHRVAREGAMAAFPVIASSSLIEQVAFRRAPLSTFATGSEPARAMARLWQGIEAKLAERGVA